MMLRWRRDLRPETADRVRRAGADAIFDAAHFLLEEANQTIPHEEGVMAASGDVDIDGTAATVFYDTPYAVRQHEDTRLRHDPGRRAKWLERTGDEQEGRIRRFIEDRLVEATS